MENTRVLLLVGDSPSLTSGFAKVVQNLARRWKQYFDRIDFWAIGYSGYPGKPGRCNDVEWRDPKYVIYPASYNDPWHSTERLQALINHTISGDYTHVWIIQDHFLLNQHKFPEVFSSACASTVDSQGNAIHRKKTYYYAPVDGVMEKSWAEVVRWFDYPVAYSAYAKSEIERHIGATDMPHIPHGVDTDVYKPMPDRAMLRERCSRGWLNPDDIVLLNVNANQRRKDVIRSLEILARLRQHDQRYKLIMHMSELQPMTDGISLKIAAAQLGLVHGEDWMCTDDGKNFRGLLGTMTEADLNDLFNCADIYLTTTLGEGFGLGQVEALAAGLAVTMPMHTACKELADGIEARGMHNRVIRLPIEDGTICLNMDNSRLRHRVDLAGAVNAILDFVQQNEKLMGLRGGLNDQVRDWLSWDRIAGEWIKLFELPKPRKNL